MKVLHIINSLDIGGAERLLVDLLPRLSKKNITTDLLLLNGKKTAFYRSIEQQNLNKIQSTGLKNSYNPLAVLKIIKYLKGYDLLHVHLMPSLYWVFLAKRLSSSPAKLIYTEHSNISAKRSNIFINFVDHLIYKRLDAIICISTAIENSLKNHLKKTSYPLHIITNGVSLSRFKGIHPANRQKYRLSENDFIVVQVSSFRPAKDQDTIIRAIATLPHSFKAVFVGDGPRKKTCMALAHELHVADRILFLGNSSEIPQLLQMADLVVLSSHFEGFGLAALEGMASRRPVIASDVAGLCDVVGDAGILFKQGDHHTLGDILKKFWGDRDYYDRIAQRCLERSALYGMESMVQQYAQLYHRL